MTIEIVGNWHKGLAYDLHTLDSTYIGDNEQGHPRFESTYSEMGALLKRLKYRNDRASAVQMVTLLDGISGIEEFDYIIPAPSSNRSRPYQPVDELAVQLGARRNVPVLIDFLKKTEGGPELKNIDDPSEREMLLRKTISIARPENITGKKVLLVDDLYRSGATLYVATDILYNKSHVKKVSVLTMTKTRSHR